MELPELGVGITYSQAVEPLLARYPSLIDVVEVEPQTTWIERRDAPEHYRVPSDVLEHIAALPGRKLVHSVGVPVGGTVRPEPAQLALLQHTITRFDSPWASEHLSFNSTPEFRTGFFLPARQTWAGVETATTSIRNLQGALSVPLAVETGVNYLRRRPDELPDGAFVSAVVQTADCGLLLDLHNVFTNAYNGRQPMEEFLAQLPLDRVWELHLAGGFEMDGYWLDAHSGAMPEVLLTIAAKVVPRLPNLKAIIFEIFPAYIPVVGLELVREQLERVRELWDQRGRVSHSTASPQRPMIQRNQPQPSILARADAADDGPSPETWEHVLGQLVIGVGHEGQDDAGTVNELRSDPGIGIVRRLIREFRASSVVSVLRLTSRLLMLALGPDVFRSILDDFWSRTPPEHYASTEAEAFARYLDELHLQVPHLADVLAFERAILATLIDDQPRVVTFGWNPLPLLRALAEGHLPSDAAELGDFEIEITPGMPLGASSGAGSDRTQTVFPYH